MKIMLGILAVCILLGSPVFAQVQDDRNSPYPLNRYHDGEEQTVLDWQKIVDRANQTRERMAAEKAAAQRAATVSRPEDRQAAPRN